MRLATFLFVILSLGLTNQDAQAQSCDCVYPIIFAHGYTGSQNSWTDFYNDGRIAGIWGSTQLYHGVINANTQSNIWGSDGTPGTGDDDVLVEFGNLSNDLNSGCLYAYNWENFWNENEADPQIIIQDGSAPSFFSSDSNESAAFKQGYALSTMIDKVLLANPTKSHVIIVGHSMGGLVGREYVQRANGRWWARADGHRVKKLVTLATPHRGSNFFGNPFPSPDAEKNGDDRSAIYMDGFPDINAEATRDLRYSTSTSSCFPFFPRHSPYLYGGDEGCIAAGYWNDDVNVDGDENDDIVGINIQGTSSVVDGTYDNPAMPLPQDLRYTYITSSVDLVVAEDRQRLFLGNDPRPVEPALPGVAHLLADTMDIDAWHLSQTDEVRDIIRAIDEGDYPKYAWEISTGTTFGGIPNLRSFAVPAPEATPSHDPDWFVADLAASQAPDMECTISFAAGGGLTGRVDFYETAPSDFSNADSGLFATTTGSTTLTTPLINPGLYYLRVYHEGIDKDSWEIPYKISAVCEPVLLPVEMTSFEAVHDGEFVSLSWSTSSEIGSLGFEVQSLKYLQGDRKDDNSWESKGFVESRGSVEAGAEYTFKVAQEGLGNNLYRLKQVDLDGKIWYSSSVEVEVPLSAQVKVFDAYPNPFSSSASLNFRVAEEQSYVAGLYNSFGQRVRTLANGIATPGSDQVLTINSSDLSSGTYIVSIVGENFAAKQFVTLSK